MAGDGERDENAKACADSGEAGAGGGTLVA